MTNIIIGLCVGAGSAIILFVLWRAAEKLRRDLQRRDTSADARKPFDRTGQ